MCFCIFKLVWRCDGLTYKNNLMMFKRDCWLGYEILTIY